MKKLMLVVAIGTLFSVACLAAVNPGKGASKIAVPAATASAPQSELPQCPSDTIGPKDIEVTNSNDGVPVKEKTMYAPVGGQIILSLPFFVDGYVWQLMPAQSDTWKAVCRGIVQAPLGGRGKDIFVVKLTKPGGAAIHAIRIRPWEPKKPADKFTLLVHVNSSSEEKEGLNQNKDGCDTTRCPPGMCCSQYYDGTGAVCYLCK